MFSPVDRRYSSILASTTQLKVPVPFTITLGQGFVSVVVVNTNQVSFPQSNPRFALLEGSAVAGIPWHHRP